MAFSLRPWDSAFELLRTLQAHEDLPVSAWKFQPFPLSCYWISCFSRPRPRRHYNFAQSWSFLVRPEIFSFPCGFSPQRQCFQEKVRISFCFFLLLFIFPMWFEKLRFHLVHFIPLVHFPAMRVTFPWLFLSSNNPVPHLKWKVWVLLHSGYSKQMFWGMESAIPQGLIHTSYDKLGLYKILLEFRAGFHAAHT